MEKTKRDFTMIFTDGACSGNPGPGGWGAIVLTPDNQIQELGAGSPSTTNNRMEMTATVEALRFIQNIPGPVHFYTDSTYVIRGITQWVFGWRRNGWKTAEGQEVSNKDIWEELSKLVQARGATGKIDWRYSRGHVGIPGNERCDRIAVAFSKNEYVNLYSGDFDSYNVNIMEVPKDTSLPAMKSPTEKKTAFSYLSNIGGLVYRHRDWGSCQRRVHGQSGAKFKKALSRDDESEILKSWGLDPSSPIQEG